MFLAIFFNYLTFYQLNKTKGKLAQSLPFVLTRVVAYHAQKAQHDTRCIP